MRRLILKLIALPERLINFVILRRKRVTYDPTLRIKGTIGIYGSGEITLGSDVRINSCQWANPGMGCYPKTVFHVPSGVLKIGNHVGMSSVAISCRERVTIGDYVLLGGGVKIMDHDAHSLDYACRAQGGSSDVPVSRPVTIEEHAFIGANSIILKGVTIGARAVIGAGSVVTRDVPADEIWAGNPARCIRGTSR